MESVFGVPKMVVRQSSLSTDPVDNYLQQSQKNRKSLDSETNVFEIYNNEDQFNPFECTRKSNLYQIVEQEDSTYDSQTTNTSEKKSQFNTTSSAKSEADENINDPKMEKLL